MTEKTKKELLDDIHDMELTIQKQDYDISEKGIQLATDKRQISEMTDEIASLKEKYFSMNREMAVHIMRNVSNELADSGFKLRLELAISLMHGDSLEAYAKAIVGSPRGLRVVLKSLGGDGFPRKINIIKTIRQFTGFGLKEAKDASETPNWESIGLDDVTARKFHAALLAEGAIAELV